MRLGPNVPNPIALTWYDADDLLVLDGPGSGTTLWDVPVDGQPATKLPGVLPGAVSITANSAQNALVVGLSDGRMEVSASLEGPWQQLGSERPEPGLPGPRHPGARRSRNVLTGRAASTAMSSRAISTLRSRYVTICD